jgi:hypothetical protein
LRGNAIIAEIVSRIAIGHQHFFETLLTLYNSPVSLWPRSKQALGSEMILVILWLDHVHLNVYGRFEETQIVSYDNYRNQAV